jgi:tetratricopeptide (TPR) repeat protein
MSTEKSRALNSNGGARGLFRICFLFVALASLSLNAQPNTNAVSGVDTNSQETLRSVLRLQEQLSATQLAIERNQQEADAAATRRAEALEGRLTGIEQNIAAQRSKELEAIQSYNKIMLIVACVFGGLGCLAMLLTAYFQWRTVNRLTEISSALPALSGGPSLAAISAGDADRISIGPAGQSNQRLLGALDKLEKRIFELEHTARPHVENDAAGARASAASAPASPDAAQITLLLGKGQSLLNLDQNEEAILCFDQVLALDGNHPEALVKKGAALERLRKLDEAIACYDRAIAADGSMTVAYLYKGGLFNRLERFNEALECYEKALRTQENRATV